MMPRCVPPTATGFPRRRMSAACSTDAKKASASKWTIALGIHPLSFPFANERHHDSLNHQFTNRNEFWIFGILSFQVGFAVVRDKRFERAITVNQGRNNIVIARRLPVFDYHYVTVDDVFAGHGIPPHFECK